MASPNSESDLTSMFMQRGDGRRAKSPPRPEAAAARGTVAKAGAAAEVITVKDFFDFMKTAYQVYEHLEGDEDEGSKINWEELTKLTVLNHVIEQQERELLSRAAHAEQRAVTSQSDSAVERRGAARVDKRHSCGDIEGRGRRASLPEARVEMLGVWTEANLNCKLNDVINEGILDSILPYLVGYKKQSKTTSVYAPIIKKSPTSSSADVKKPASFGGFVNEKESRDRLGRRKSSVAAGHERANQQHDGEVEIHVCDEVKGLKKDFRCAQKLLVSKMGYFADVTAGQRLEDMDISVHCDIQIFEWLMRWVKRDSILVADWPLLDAHNVVPILVSASFLQMEPLLHDCLMYCHAHMNDIVKTATNLACLSDGLLTRLAAMYTNAELEALRDRKDKIQSRLYCKMILSLAEPVPETLRGHYATLATLFKCSRCGKLLGRHVAPHVPCQPASMRIDRRGHVVSSHAKEPAWSLGEYVSWLYGELRSWRRVYWRLWADCHFLRCQLCDSFFPAYQMEWCSHHEQGAHMFALAAGRHACCGQRAYRFETLPRSSGCQFREHAPDERLAADAAVAALYARHRDVVAMRPPQPLLPERLARLVPRDAGDEAGGRLQCAEVFWWEGIRLAPPRAPLGLLGKLYTSDDKFNRERARRPRRRAGDSLPVETRLTRRSSPARRLRRELERNAIANRCKYTPHIGKRCAAPLSVAPCAALARPGSPALAARAAPSPCPTAPGPPAPGADRKPLRDDAPNNKQGAGGAAGGSCGDGAGSEAARSDTDRSDQSCDSGASDEDAPRQSRARVRAPPPAARTPARRGRAAGRVWLAAQSARSNQDGQRRFEERAATHMRAALARRHHHASRTRPHPGGAIVRLEAEWRERHGGAGGGAGARRGGSVRRHAPLKYK
ncbi:uncharacterized protein LOC112050728 [Bicyclus anynana]|uniref:Uncharacterized protein LOC112050728 n=1 Tax=Bicyclus anynana TaxID=110368 RepID=A0ABM3LIK1_BICAN|nr:uncharacterized protein LOC112050728 [Bicyclus anynana]